MPSDNNQRTLVPTTFIQEGTRIRTDYGDLTSLAESIRELGLIHPIVINVAGVLVAGGRRFRAMRDVLKLTEIPITYFEFADEATLRILEREENVRRKSMTWQEEVISIAEVHQHHALTSALKSERWTQDATGEILGVSRASVTYALQLADLVRAKDKEILACPRANDALAVLAKRRANESNKIIAKMTLPDAPASASVTDQDLDALFAPVKQSSGGVGELKDDGEMPGQVAALADQIEVPLSRMLFNMDAIDFLERLPAESVDHVITDWPYGIDMENIQQTNGGLNVESTAAEHDVTENVALHEVVIPAIYRAIKPGGFFITWTDMDHWEKNKQDCIKAGFKVQRWPLIWYKTSRCQNMAAAYNFTKNYEIAIVCRKGIATLLAPQPSSIIVAGREDSAQVFGHPFAKPYQVWATLYSAVAQRGQVVLDPFAGRGSSVVAALTYGLQPLACELKDEHFNGLVVNVKEWYQKSLPNVKFT